MWKNLSEILVSVFVVLVLLVKADPFHWLMPNDVQMILLCVFAVGFGVYAGVLFRERPQDEREAFHLYRASRMAYLAGVITLSAVIVIQDIYHRLDTSLILVLGVMIVVKLIVLLYSKYKN